MIPCDCSPPLVWSVAFACYQWASTMIRSLFACSMHDLPVCWHPAWSVVCTSLCLSASCKARWVCSLPAWFVVFGYYLHNPLNLLYDPLSCLLNMIRRIILLRAWYVVLYTFPGLSVYFSPLPARPGAFARFWVIQCLRSFPAYSVGFVCTFNDPFIVLRSISGPMICTLHALFNDLILHDP